MRKPGSSRPSSKEKPERLPGSPVKPATSPYPESRAHDEKEDPHDPAPTTARQAGSLTNRAHRRAPPSRWGSPRRLGPRKYSA